MLDAGGVDADAAERHGSLAVALAGRGAGLFDHRHLHPIDLVEALRHGARRRVGRLGDRLGQQGGEAVGIGVPRQHGGEEGLAALELRGAAGDGDAHRGDVGFHLRDLALHPRHIAVERLERAVGGDRRPQTQENDRKSGRHLHLRADREAAQALAVVQENIAGFKNVAETGGQAGVRCQYVACHHYPRSAWLRPERSRLATA